MSRLIRADVLKRRTRQLIQIRPITKKAFCITASPICRARFRELRPLRLTNATLPYALALANKGFEQAIADDAGLKEGVNTYAGKLHLRSRRRFARISNTRRSIRLLMVQSARIAKV